MEVIHDQIGSPTYAKDLAQATLQLVKRRAPGLYHVANSGQATWCELAAEAVRQASLPCSVRAVASSDKTLRANYEVLSSAKYHRMSHASLVSGPAGIHLLGPSCLPITAADMP